MSTQAAPRPPRVRDPERADKILAAAARLFAAQGFHPVSLAQIGREAGIVGSGVYRHFDNKAAVLLALLDRAMDELLRQTDEVLAQALPPARTVSRLIDTQVEFCLEQRLAVQLYRSEVTALDPGQARRLRSLQRRYNEEWVRALVAARPELTDPWARAIVHATIGAIQSAVSYDSALDRDRQADVLRAVAHACMAAAESTATR